MWTLLGTLRPAFLPARKLNCALIWTIWSKVHIPLLVLGKIKSAVNALRFDTQLDACLRTKWEEMMIQQHRSMDSKEESTICTCCFIPYWSCNGKNKLARHLLATSVVCFYACNDTLNSVVDSPPHTHTNPSTSFFSLYPVPEKQCQQNCPNECTLCFLCLFRAKIWS